MDPGISPGKVWRFGGSCRIFSRFALLCRVSKILFLPLARIICPALTGGDPESLTSAICQYVDKFGATVVPTGDDRDSLLQRNWDEVASRVGLEGLLDNSNQVHRARLLAASAPSSGAVA